MALILFEDIFDVKDIDPDGKKFERGLIPCAHELSFASRRFCRFVCAEALILMITIVKHCYTGEGSSLAGVIFFC